MNVNNRISNSVSICGSGRVRVNVGLVLRLVFLLAFMALRSLAYEGYLTVIRCLFDGDSMFI